ncbi:Hsp70 family protein [bacterium]|nr:Hsp70 family protein [bacterium]
MGKLKTKISPYKLGIDLGTSNSAVSIFYKGKGEVLEVDGQKVVPSIVAFKNKETILVGYQAKRQILINPDTTIRSIKREMGNEEFSVEFFGTKYGPVDISKIILDKLREGAQQQKKINLRGSAKYAVICIPANFDDNKKRDTREAGEKAGLQVLYLLEEPVAAAIAYGFEKERDQTILVYDLGGGTFDVSILKVDSSQKDTSLQVLAKEGIPQCGGDDIDQRLMDKISEEFKAANQIDIYDLKKDQAGGVSKKVLKEAQQKLKEAVELAKIELSEAQSTQITIPAFLKDGDGKEYQIDREVKREEFEDLVRDIIQQTEDTVKKALDAAKLSIDDISRIILVGGSTRMPLVKEMLTKMFDKEPYSDLDPSTVVSVGAAIFGATLDIPAEMTEDTEAENEEDKIDKKINTSNIVTHHLGIEIATREKRQLFSKLIEKGLELNEETPEIVAAKDYTTQRDDQTEMRIGVFQAEGDVEYVTEKGVVCIGEFWLTGIPKGKAGRELVTVTFKVNMQNEVVIKAQSKSNEGIVTELTLQRN